MDLFYSMHMHSNPDFTPVFCLIRIHVFIVIADLPKFLSLLCYLANAFLVYLYGY